MHGPISLVTVCGSPLLLRRAVRADGGEAFHEVWQLVAELWQGCGASLGDASSALLGGSGLSRVRFRNHPQRGYFCYRLSISLH